RARGRQRAGGQGQRADRVRRRDPHRRQPVRRPEGRLLRQVLTALLRRRILEAHGKLRPKARMATRHAPRHALRWAPGTPRPPATGAGASRWKGRAGGGKTALVRLLAWRTLRATFRPTGPARDPITATRAH